MLFNDSMKDQIHTAGKPLDLVEPKNKIQKEALQKAKSKLEKGLILLAAHQKQIKLADRSEYRWEIADKYKDYGLTMDKDDTKRIKKSKMAVVAKTPKRKKAANCCTSRQVQGCLKKTWEQLPAHEQGGCYPSQANWSQATSSSRLPRVPGLCFYCGEMVTHKNRNRNKFPGKKTSK